MSNILAALGYLFDMPESTIASTSGVASPATPPEPVFRPELMSPEPRQVICKRFVPAADPIVISDDDEPPPQPRNKGKGRALDQDKFNVPSPQKGKISTLNLVDDDSDEDMPLTRAPAPARRPRSPSPKLDLEDAALASILAIVPDALPSHVLMLLLSEKYGANADLVVEALWAGEYPKVDVKGKKRAREPEAETDKPVARDYTDTSWRKVPDVPYKQKAWVSISCRRPVAREG